MGLGKHGDILPLLGIVVELFDEFLQEGNIDIGECLLDGKGHGGVVDILGCEAEVDELLEGYGGITAAYWAEGIDALLDEILDGLHVVIGHLLDVLHTLSVLYGKVAVDIAEWLI
jgi:hypothetical protein